MVMPVFCFVVSKIRHKAVIGKQFQSNLLKTLAFKRAGTKVWGAYVLFHSPSVGVGVGVCIGS